MNWYRSSTLLEILEKLPTISSLQEDNVLQVQHVLRPKTEQHHDYRGLQERSILAVFKWVIRFWFTLVDDPVKSKALKNMASLLGKRKRAKALPSY